MFGEDMIMVGKSLVECQMHDIISTPAAMGV